jgi:hypothetical protein
MGGHDELGFRDSVLGFRESSVLQVSSMSRLARLSAKSPGFVSAVAAAEVAGKAGCARVVTFDAEAVRLPAFEAL